MRQEAVGGGEPSVTSKFHINTVHRAIVWRGVVLHAFRNLQNNFIFGDQNDDFTRSSLLYCG